MYWLKSHQAASIKKPKIIIVSGSNSMFGISSKEMSALTGYPVINLAMHGAMDIDFLFFQIKEQVNEGDMVILPLEDVYYTRQKPTDFFISEVMLLGWHYFYSLSPMEFVKFIVSVKPKRVWDGILKKVKYFSEDVTHEQILTVVQNHIEGKWNGYGYHSMNIYGDINVNEETTKKIKRINPNYAEFREPMSKHFLSTYEKITRVVKANGGQLTLTWPVTMKNKNFNLQQHKFKTIINVFRDRLATHGIKIECNPVDFNLSREFFFNERYHLNYSGAKIRTKKLATCINELLKLKEKNRLKPLNLKSQ